MNPVQLQAPVQPDLHDTDAEARIIGAVLNDEKVFWSIESLVKADDFAAEANMKLWEEIARRKGANQSVSVFSLKTFAQADPDVVESGGSMYLTTLTAHRPTASSLLEYARAVHRLAQRRALKDMALRIISEVHERPDQDALALCDRIGERAYEIGHTGSGKDGPVAYGEIIRRAAERAEAAKNNPGSSYITTGLKALDVVTGGFSQGDEIVLGAGSNMGKSGLVQQLMESAGGTGHPTLMFSHEMQADELGDRGLGAHTGVPADRLERGEISDKEMDRIALDLSRFDGMPIRVDETPRLSVAQMRARAFAVSRKIGALKLIIVDHLRFVVPADRRADERDQIHQITMDLKHLAKELRCTVLIISPLNREFWKRSNRRPQTSDLYGSSAIEYNADQIWLLHRDEFYLDQDRPDQADEKAYGQWLDAVNRAAGWADVIVAKRRRGKKGTARLRFNEPLIRFSDPEPEQAAIPQEDLLALTGQGR